MKKTGMDAIERKLQSFLDIGKHLLQLQKLHSP